MKPLISIHLLPSGRILKAPAGQPLAEVLFPEGVEFPCGGRGRCRGCRVRVLSGELPETAADRERLRPEERRAGWRLACQAVAETDLVLELAQWQVPVLTDERPVPWQPGEGLGVAVDVGTTTIAAQLVDLRTGEVRAVQTALNAQARHGADLVSRLEFALQPGGRNTLTELCRGQIHQMIRDLIGDSDASPAALRTVVLVGNTVMHHLFSGLEVESLASFPFEPVTTEAQPFRPDQLGWHLPNDVRVWFLPCLGGFVGSDVLAGILATRLDEAQACEALLDLGTNGEIVVAQQGQLYCTSTAAGPAFEGARLTMGMRAAAGAIARVAIRDGRLVCEVLGGGPARGICGSGLVDAVAAALEMGWITPGGRLELPGLLPLTDSVHLTQQDIRELQLAKAAIAAGLRLLLRQCGASLEAIHQIHLAGAFGNALDPVSAHRIGLLEVDPARVQSAGNTALRGARIALSLRGPDDPILARICRSVVHVPLHTLPEFEETFASCLGFPRS
ncbi:ASKHA domain-containing protein [Limisphaera sp. VF-2]|jgi:uncharacterized 2Fe-2S/4Fe-4S cluster protein (DUF4445 family)|uniref:ASKHA domain-containing protein n=1 Tax=Limisphaera sp. VF-2 TaxID=3400418 RepID=UPI001765B63E|nr:ASKHA domain-containing protein [Limisphaera sp.]